MATYMVTGPDGRQYRVTAPDGATQEQALQYAQQNFQSAGAPQATNAGGHVKRVQYPDGSVHRIEVPEGATNDQIIEVAQQDYQRRSGGRSLAQLKALSPAYAAMSDEDFGQRMYQRYYADRMSYEEFQDRTRSGTPTAPASNVGTTRLQKIERALRAADAAGNTGDARRLAQAYVTERDSGQGTGTGSPGSPIRVEGPDGQLYEFPAGTSRDVMRTALQKRYGPPQVPMAPERPSFGNVQSSAGTVADYPRSTVPYEGPLLAESTAAAGVPAAPTLAETNAANRALRNSPEGQAMFDRAMLDAKRHTFQGLPAGMRMVIGAGSRVAAAGRGIGQLYAAAADQIAPRDQSLAGLIAGQPSRYDEAMARETEARKRDRYLEGDYAGTVGRFVGDVGLLAAPAGAVGRLSGVRALAGNVGLGAAYAGLQPVVEGESRATNTALGGALGGAGYGLAAGVSAAGRRAMQAIPQDVRQMARQANELGIPVHASQVSQSLPAKVAGSAGKYLPFSGYASAAGRQQEGINRAVARTFGVDAPKLTDDVMQRARQDLSRQFEEIYNRNSVPITEKAARKLLEVEREAGRRLTKDEGQVLRNQLDDILENAEDGVLTGQKYQAVRTALRKAEGNDKLGMAVRELRQALDDIAGDAVGAEDAAALKTLRSEWANFRTVEQALKQVSGAGGDVRLASLWPLIRKGSTKEMRELARMGQTLLKDPIADSGTAQRSLLYNLLMGGGSIANPALIPLIAKAAAGGATVGRAANSNTLARLMTRESRGVPTSKLGAMLQQGVPYAAPIAAERYEGATR